MNQVEPTKSVPVAIIGMGCMFPKAEDLAAFWSNTRRGVDAITEVPPSHWRPDDYFDADPKSPDRTYARRGGFLNPVDFPPLDFGIAPANLEATDTTQLLGLMVARQALDDAGYGEGSSRPLDRDRVSVILGVTGTLELVIPLGARLGHPIWRRALKASGVPDDTAEEVVRKISDSYVGWQENSFPGLLGNVAAGRIANRLDLHGTNCVVDAACASSLAAINLAVLELSTGRCDLALSGGLDTFNDIFMYMCFSKTPALSPRGEARPFDAGCDGTTLGEGLGVIALKRLDDAERDGDTIYAVIRGMGSSSDGKGNAVYAPSAEGQARALRAAYREAGVSPASVGLVEAHGTGTKVGDATELAALNEVFGAEDGRPAWCALGSVKSQIGHTKAAAGVAGVIKAALALRHKVLPPTIKVDRPLEGVQAGGGSPFYLNTEAGPWLRQGELPRRASVSAFGFGGSNFHCVLEESGREKPGIDWDGSTQIVALAGPSSEALVAAMGAWPVAQTWAEFREHAARSRESFRPDQDHRIVFVVNRDDDLAARFKDARATLQAGAAKRPTPGIFLGAGAVSGKLAMLFPGQGSQYVGMGREFACLFPQVQSALAAANDAGPSSSRLSANIYPPPAFDDPARDAQEAALRATDVAQPAIGALGLGLLEVLAHFGVRPDAVAGHSFGELTALHASGRLDARSFLHLARVRGELMAEQAATGGGGMLAVLDSSDVVGATLKAEGLDGQVVVANRNAPKQVVLSGPEDAIARAASAFERRNVPTRALAVSAAFHSAAVSSASGPFLNAVRAETLAASDIPVFANTTAKPYPSDPSDAAALLAGQLAEPVEFAAGLEAMRVWGVSTFLEVGPDAKLTGLVRATLGVDSRAIALDASRGRRGNLHDLALALAELVAVGYPVNLARWDEPARTGRQTIRKPGLTVKICGANATPKPRPPAKPTVATPPPMTPTPPARHPNAAADPVISPRPPVVANGDGNASKPGRNGHVAPARAAENGKAAPAPPSSPPLPKTLPLVPLGDGDSTRVAAALRTAQENLQALQRLGEQTADLHRLFLEGQDRTQRTFQSLLEQHQRLTLASVGLDGDTNVAPTFPRSNGHASESATAAPLHISRSNLAGPSSPKPKPVAPPVSTAPRVTTTPRPSPAAAPVPKAARVTDVPKPTRAIAQPVALVSPKGSDDRAQSVLLEVVAEKTGYPAEMLEPAMRLDADLGIDSIKRVEILSALQERLPDAPLVKPEHLGSLHTLRDIVEFLQAGRAGSNTTGKSGTDSGPGQTQSILLEVVAEKTGYPAEMLEPAMRLDADLGIDSIKRVEILSALQERLPDAPAVKPEHLGSLHTLRDIIEFLDSSDRPVASVEAEKTSGSFHVQSVLLEVVAEKTGYPAEMLEPAMRLDADLGIDSIKRVEILSALQERLPDAPLVKPEHLGSLHTLRDIVEFLDGASIPTVEHPSSSRVRATADTPESSTKGQTLQRHSLQVVPAPASPGILRIAGPESVIWILDDGSDLAPSLAQRLGGQVIGREAVATLDKPGRLDALVLIAPTTFEGDGTSVKTAFRLMRHAGPALREAKGLLVTVSRLDGTFNTRDGEADPSSNGLAGLLKTAAREWPEVNCKAVDLDPTLEDPATALAEEMTRPGPLEVGLSRAGRTTVELRLSPLGASSNRSAPIGPGDLVVITGGARGVTAEVAVALATAYRPTLVLLGRSPAPAAEPEWLVSLHSEAEIKRAFADRADGRISPQKIGEQFRGVMAAREIRETLSRIEATGSPAHYRSVDVRDPVAVRAALAEFGPVRGLVHGAGVLADRRIVDLTDDAFADVFDTKVGGLNSIAPLMVDPKLMVLFSSTTARFGRVGQAAYAAANEVLNAWARGEARRRPDCRVVAVNWGPWDGGMVTPSLKPLFAAEGVGLIGLKEGSAFLVEEISSADRATEVIVLGGGTLPAVTGASVARSGPGSNIVPVATEPPSPIPVAASNLKTVFERPLDLDAMPILKSHVIDGRAVVPMALILEWLAQGTLQRNPGLAFHGVENLRVVKGAVFSAERREVLAVRVGKATKGNGVYVVPVDLRGMFADGSTVTHATAEVLLGDVPASAGPAGAVGGFAAYPHSARKVYHDLLFHGPDLHAIDRIEGLDGSGIAAWVKTGPAATEWFGRPLRQGWLSDPLALDGAFQLMCLWCHEVTGSTSLPTGLAKYHQFGPTFPSPLVRVSARVTRPSEYRALADFEVTDPADGRLVARLEGYECMIDPSLVEKFRRNRLGHPQPAKARAARGGR